MHRDIGDAIQNRSLDFFGEHALLIHFENRIAMIAGRQRLKISMNLDRRPALPQLIGNPIGLPHGQLAAACADSKCVGLLPKTIFLNAVGVLRYDNKDTYLRSTSPFENRAASLQVVPVVKHVVDEENVRAVETVSCSLHLITTTNVTKSTGTRKFALRGVS